MEIYLSEAEKKREQMYNAIVSRWRECAERRAVTPNRYMNSIAAELGLSAAQVRRVLIMKGEYCKW